MSNTEGAREDQGGDAPHDSDTIEKGPAESRFRVLVVDDGDVIRGASGWDTAEQAGRAVMVLAETYGFNESLHIEVRQ